MNIPNLTQLRDFLLTLPEEDFDMSEEGWCFSDARNGVCCSAACIGGWARAIFQCEWSLIKVGRVSLGLSADAIEDLFYPNLMIGKYDPYDATPTQAANVLTHLINTGEVDWTKMDVQATDERSGLMA